jgi:CheY-like chemotaxis protein
VPFTSPKPIDPPPSEVVGATVLVVDDERAWRVILETDLRMLRYRVVLAQDAEEALERARTDGPDVAIVDLMLPEPMDGWTLMGALRAQGTPVPVIFYTAYPVFPNRPDDEDAVGFVSKADDRADLYALLPDAIRKTKKSRRP